MVVQIAAQPNTQKATDLVAEEHKAAQHRQVLHAKHLRDDAIGQRHGRQPQKAHDGGKGVDRPGRQRHQQEDDDGHRPDKVNAREQVALGHVLAQGASQVGAKNVEQANQRERVAGYMRRQTRIFEVAGHVHANKHDLKATHKIPSREQQEAGVFKGLGHSLGDGLVVATGGSLFAGLQVRLAQGQGQRHNNHHQHRAGQQGVAPAKLGNQLPLYRHHKKLAKRARSGGHAHGPRAFVGRQLPANDPVNDGIGGASLGNANQQACG